MDNPLYSRTKVSQVVSQVNWLQKTIGATDIASFCVNHRWPSWSLHRLERSWLWFLLPPTFCGTVVETEWGGVEKVGTRCEDATPETPETRQFWRSMVLLVSWFSTWCDELGCDAVMNMAWIQPQSWQVCICFVASWVIYFQGQRSLCCSLCARGQAEGGCFSR